MRWLRRIRPLACREVVEFISDYLEGTLPSRQAVRLERHLTGCDPCFEYVGQIRTTVTLAHQVPPDAVEPVTTQRLIELYRTWQRPPT